MKYSSLCIVSHSGYLNHINCLETFDLWEKKSEFSHIGPSYCIVLPTWLIVNKLYHVMNKARIPPVVCRKARVLSTSFVIVYAYCGVQHNLCCVFVLFFLVLCDFCCQFDCPFLIAPSIFSNVYILLAWRLTILNQSTMRFCLT